MESGFSAEQIEAELRNLRGVIAARVVIADDGIQEIHILSTQNRPVKQLVRDVEALCAARFRLDLDHRKVSVAQIDMPPAQAERMPRPRLLGVRLETAGDDVVAAVQMGVGSRVYVGEARGHAVNAVRPRLAALAAISALEQCTEGACRVELTDLTEFRLADQTGYAAVVSLLGKAGEEKLIGCALARSDVPEACVRAVLDAVNRRLLQFSEERQMGRYEAVIG